MRANRRQPISKPRKKSPAIQFSRGFFIGEFLLREGNYFLVMVSLG